MAFDASADDRDTRGFISMTTIRPSAGLTANWMFEPPVSTPTRRMIRRAASRIRWYSLSVSVSAGATVMLSPVCTPIGSTFSIEQMTTKLSATSRITSSSNSFQPMTDSSIRTSCTGLRLEAARGQLAELLDVVGDAAADAAERERGPDDRREARSSRRASSASSSERARPLVGHLDADLLHRVAEQQPILGDLDRVELRADQLDAVLREDALLVQRDGEVERRLAADGRQHRVGPLLAR